MWQNMKTFKNEQGVYFTWILSRQFLQKKYFMDLYKIAYELER